MSREIKFRAWDEDNEVMLEPQDLSQCGAAWDWLGEYDVQLMQYTGLTDKNGVEIFEGDILGGDPHGTASVVWDSVSACFCTKGVGTMNHPEMSGQLSLLFNDLEDCGDEWSVIGNIHETPKLLEVNHDQEEK